MKLLGKRKELEPGKVQYLFEGNFTINIVSKLKKVLMDDMDRNSELVLDLRKVDKFDTAGAQLLIHLSREANKRNVRLSLAEKSGAVDRVFNLFGLNL